MSKSKLKNDKFVFYFSLFFFFWVITLLFISSFYSGNHYESYDLDWSKYQEENKTVFTLENPIYLEKDSLLVFKNNNHIEVKVNHEILYQDHDFVSDANVHSQFISEPTVYFPLTNGLIENMTITFDSNSSTPLKENIQIYSYEHFFSGVFQQILPSFAIFVLFLFISLFCCFFFLYHHCKKIINVSNELIYFSIFSFLCGLFIFSMNSSLNVLINNMKYISFVNLSSFLFLSFFLLLFLKDSLTQKKNGYYLLLFTSIFLIIFSFFCHFSGIYSLYQTSFCTYLLNISILIYFIYCNYKQFKSSHEKKLKVLLAGLIAYCAFSVLSFSLFVFNDYTIHASFYVVGILVLYVCTFYLTLHKNYTLFLELKNLEFIKNQAYQDSFTRTLNRSAYIVDVNKLTGPFTLFVIDINSLKNINDTKGHREGDKIILRCSDVLREAFADDARIYRFGGDEFVVILPTHDYAHYLSKLSFSLLRANEGERVPLTFSIGYATGELAHPSFASVEKVFDEADQNMYKEKQKFYKKHDRRKSRK